MTVKQIILTLSIQIFSLVLFGQKPTCKSLHTGSFKVVTKESGTTIIKRTKKLQTEKNDDFGYEIIFEIVWINECTYELRPKKVIKGDPSIIGDGTQVVKARIKEITNNTYIAETSSNFTAEVLNIVVEIIK